MTTEMIKIEERNGMNAVNARELHEVLGSKQEFANWIKNRIEKYGFVENQDFEVFDNFINNPQGGRPSKEYALSIDMAKELAMVENNEKGRRVRQYFIQKEKEAKQMSLALPKDLPTALRMLADKVEENSQQQKVIEEQNVVISDMTNQIADMQEKVSYVDKILSCKSTITTTVIAQDYGMSAKAFNKELHNLGIQHKVGGQWILYAKYLALGYVHSKAFEFERKDGSKDVHYNTEWTQKGRLFLYETLKREGILPLIEQ